MPDILVLVVIVAVLCFGMVLLTGAPYLPTLKAQQQEALDALDLSAGQTMLELGCGDGRVLCAAAERGWHVVGYELNPLLALYAWLRTRRYKGRVRVVCGNYWKESWPPAAGIFTFLLPKYMERLDKKIIQYKHKPVKLVSIAFAIPARQPDGESRRVFCYKYDA